MRKAYAIAGAPDNVKVYHYKKFADPNTRKNVKHLPEGLDRNESFRMVNADGPNHYFKSELVVPMVERIIGRKMKCSD